MAELFAQLGYIRKRVIPVTVEDGVIDCPNVIVLGPKNTPMNLKWSIQDQANYKITQIEFDPGNSEFFDLKKDGNKNYKCKNKMTAHTSHKYTIEVEPMGGGAKIELDPMIRNEPH